MIWCINNIYYYGGNDELSIVFMRMGRHIEPRLFEMFASIFEFVCEAQNFINIDLKLADT